jgi:DnaJ-class molecular chaperone
MSIIFHHYVQLTDLEKSLAEIIVVDNKVQSDKSRISNIPASSITSKNSTVSSTTEKCQNCKGRGYIEMSSTTATCNACKGNGFIPSKTMMDYFG